MDSNSGFFSDMEAFLATTSTFNMLHALDVLDYLDEEDEREAAESSTRQRAPRRCLRRDRISVSDRRRVRRMNRMEAQPLSVDIISTLPQSIIETILCLLPIQEAARTSILSRDWRYKWTTIPKLDFTEYKFKVSIDESQLCISEQTSDAIISQRKSVIKRWKLFYAICQVFSLHRSAIHEFSLWVEPDVTCIKIDQIILLLSRSLFLNQLSLNCDYRLPLSIFNGFGNLTSLYLYNCDLYFESTFNGFGCLTSLYLKDVVCPLETLLPLLSNCPLLKSFTLLAECDYDDESAFVEVFECLPMIEHLTLSAWLIWTLVTETGRQELPTSSVYLKDFRLDRLKYLCLDDVSFTDPKFLPSLVLLIRSSPNLEKLKLQMCLEDRASLQFKVDPISLEKNSEFWLEHLIELEIEGMNSLKAESEFVMLILAKSRVLKKVSIAICNEVTKDEEIKILRSLLRSPRFNADISWSFSSNGVQASFDGLCLSRHLANDQKANLMEKMSIESEQRCIINALIYFQNKPDKTHEDIEMQNRLNAKFIKLANRLCNM